jgi:hypothetical protein
MFKHVEIMRKSSFKIMSKTYGGRCKDKNEAIYDAYPLKNLVKLLCFESLDEARNACQHYNITVRETNVKTSTGSAIEDVIFWRQSSFQEPKDPEKGTLITLQPQKMLRVIEKKLNGATRLAVCRGQVSGEGSSLDLDTVPVQSHAMNRTTHTAEQRITELRASALKEKVREEQAAAQRLAEDESRRNQEDALSNRAEIMRQQDEQRRQADVEIKRRIAEEARTRADKEKEIEQQELENRKRAEVEREMERKRAEEEESRRKQLELEQQECIRQEHERMLRAEQERSRKEEEDKRRRLEEEERRQAALEAERQRQEMEAREAEAQRQLEQQRRLQAEEESRARLYLKQKTDKARRELIFKRWLLKMPRQLGMLEAMEKTMRQIGPVTPRALSIASLASSAVERTYDGSPVQSTRRTSVLRNVLELCLRSSSKHTQTINIAEMVDCAFDTQRPRTLDLSRCGYERTTLLFTVSILLPFSTDDCHQSLCELIKIWIHTRLSYGAVNRKVNGGLDVRVAVVEEPDSVESDAVIIVLPPHWCDDRDSFATVQSLQLLSQRFSSSIPAVLLGFSEERNPNAEHIGERVEAVFDNATFLLCAGLEEPCIENALAASCEILSSDLLNQPFVMTERIPIEKLGLTVAREVIRDDDYLDRRDDVLQHVRAALDCLGEELDDLGRYQNQNEGAVWPPAVFSNKWGVVPDYFGEGVDLPLDWVSSFRLEHTGTLLRDIGDCFCGSVEDVISTLLLDAPVFIRQQAESYLHERLFRDALILAIEWREEHLGSMEKLVCLYAPSGITDTILEGTMYRWKKHVDKGVPHVLRIENDAPSDSNDPVESHFAEPFHNLRVVNEETDPQPLGALVQHVHDSEEIERDLEHYLGRNEETEQNRGHLCADEQETDVSLVGDWEQRQPKRLASESDDARDYNDYPATKRSRPSSAVVSNDLQDSRALTKKLDAYLDGSCTSRLLIGHRPLSLILRDCPPIPAEYL